MGIWAQYTSIVIPLTGAYVCSTCLLWYTFEIRCLVQYKFKMCALIHAVCKKCFKPECVFLQKCLNKWPKCSRQTTVFYMVFGCREECIFIKCVILLNDSPCLYDLLKSLVSSRVACKPCETTEVLKTSVLLWWSCFMMFNKCFFLKTFSCLPYISFPKLYNMYLCHIMLQ